MYATVSNHIAVYVRVDPISFLVLRHEYAKLRTRAIEESHSHYGTNERKEILRTLAYKDILTASMTL